jgi:pantoate--beta-alanine ligase
MVIAKLLQLIKSKTQLVICDTVREENGLAMSSRNMRLNESQKKLSLIIHQCLTNIKTEISSNTIPYLEKEATQKLIDAGFEVDYVAITDINLNKKETWNKEEPLVALIAAAINGIRLIDNMMLNEAPLLTQETTL